MLGQQSLLYLCLFTVKIFHLGLIPMFIKKCYFSSQKNKNLSTYFFLLLTLIDISDPSCQAAKECTSVLELDHKHTGALMLRAQTLVTLKEYHSALFDVKRLMELNPSSEVYRNLEARLKTQLVVPALFFLPRYFSNSITYFSY